jgi:hypothetical protein
MKPAQQPAMLGKPRANSPADGPARTFHPQLQTLAAQPEAADSRPGRDATFDHAPATTAAHRMAAVASLMI